MDLTSVITLLVAAYAAVLSSYIFFWHHRAKVNVSVRTGVPLDPLSLAKAEAAGKDFPVRIYLSASNPRPRAVVLNAMGFILPNDMTWNLIPELVKNTNVTFPHKLDYGESCEVWIDPEVLSRQFKDQGLSGNPEIFGYFKDQLGRIYKSKPFKHLHIGGGTPEGERSMKAGWTKMKKRYSGLIFLVLLNLVLLWKFGWLPEAGKLEWPPVGLCLGMQGAIFLGFPHQFRWFFPFSIPPIGWILIFLGFLLQLFGTQYGRFA